MTALRPAAAAALTATLGLAAACWVVLVWQMTGTDLDGYFCEGHGVSTFAREGGTVYHCYSSYARGTEFLWATTRALTARPTAATNTTPSDTRTGRGHGEVGCRRGQRLCGDRVVSKRSWVSIAAWRRLPAPPP